MNVTLFRLQFSFVFVWDCIEIELEIEPEIAHAGAVITIVREHRSEETFV